MAKKTIVQLVDDIDDSLIADGKGEHITFSVNGVDYEIDLGDKNAKEFHKKFDFYIEHAQRVGGRRQRTTQTSGQTAKPDPEQIKAIRKWARASGYDVSARGRISAEIEQAYNAAV